MFTMSVYKFKAAKMYSSGEIEYLCFPPKIKKPFMNYSIISKLAILTHHQLNVVNEIEAEEKRTNRRIHQSQRSAWKNYREDSEKQQHDDSYKQDAAHRREIPFSLESKDCQRKCDDSCDSNCKQNFHDFKVR